MALICLYTGDPVCRTSASHLDSLQEYDKAEWEEMSEMLTYKKFHGEGCYFSPPKFLAGFYQNLVCLEGNEFTISRSNI